MKLVFLYGPPAVGKLTVARELEKLTGFKLFHNHLTADLVKSVFDYGTPRYFDFTNKIRLDLIDAAARDNVSLITTFTYAPEDDEFIALIVSTVEHHGGEVIFVQLTTDRMTLNDRVVQDTRKEFKKLHTVESLDKSFQMWQFGGTVKYGNALSIDNTTLTSSGTARQILSYVNKSLD